MKAGDDSGLHRLKIQIRLFTLADHLGLSFYKDHFVSKVELVPYIMRVAFSIMTSTSELFLSHIKWAYPKKRRDEEQRHGDHVLGKTGRTELI